MLAHRRQHLAAHELHRHAVDGAASGVADEVLVQARHPGVLDPGGRLHLRKSGSRLGLVGGVENHLDHLRPTGQVRGSDARGISATGDRVQLRQLLRGRRTHEVPRRVNRAHRACAQETRDRPRTRTATGRILVDQRSGRKRGVIVRLGAVRAETRDAFHGLAAVAALEAALHQLLDDDVRVADRHAQGDEAVLAGHHGRWQIDQPEAELLPTHGGRAQHGAGRRGHPAGASRRGPPAGGRPARGARG